MGNATAEPERTRIVNVEHLDGFRFEIRFDDGIPALTADEPPPLGQGSGPDASRLLAAAIGNCLSASLLLCLQKSRISVSDLHSQVTLTISRNEQGRLRVGSGRVRITVSTDAEAARVDRCTRLFEDYCTVTATIRRAFPVDVEVVDGEGREIYRSEREVVVSGHGAE